MLWMMLFPCLALADNGPAVAVLYFDNQGNPELQALSVGLSQMLTTDLQQADVLVVERQQLQAVLDELELGHDGIADPSTAARVGKLIGARYLVLGSYFSLMDTLRVDVRLVETETGRIHTATGASGAPADFMRLEGELAAHLVTAVRTLPEPPVRPEPETSRGQTPTDASPAPSPTPEAPQEVDVLAPDPEALQAAVQFSQGLIHLDRKELARAREAFQSALVADPRLDDARTALASLDL